MANAETTQVFKFRISADGISSVVVPAYELQDTLKVLALATDIRTFNVDVLDAQ